jgi:hypothetical protein
VQVVTPETKCATGVCRQNVSRRRLLVDEQNLIASRYHAHIIAALSVPHWYGQQHTEAGCFFHFSVTHSLAL